MNPILYILCGLPFSGKTTLAKKLTEKLNLEYVSIDEIKFAHGFPWTEDSAITSHDWDKIFAEAYQKSAIFLKAEKSVLYDSANQDKISRDKLRKLALEIGVKSKVIWLDIPLEIIRLRYEENKTTQKRFHLPENLFQAALDTYQPPSKGEQLIPYTTNTNFENWVKENF